MKKLPIITVRNAQRRMRSDWQELQEFSERVLPLCLRQSRKGFPAKISEVDVVLVSDARMAVLHKKFMQIEGPTDVITFQHGEIFISVETAQRNARRFKTSTAAELRLYLVHGLLHLLGYDDKAETKARVMERAQRRIVEAASV